TPVKKTTAVRVRRSERRLILETCCFSFFFFEDFWAFSGGRTLIRQMIAGSPRSKVMLVTLLTRALVRSSFPGPPLEPRMKAKNRLPIPEQYGIISVPRTVPSSPPADMASRRQIIRNEAATKRARNQKGAKPVASIHLTSQVTN